MPLCCTGERIDHEGENRGQREMSRERCARRGSLILEVDLNKNERPLVSPVADDGEKTGKGAGKGR